MTIELNTTDDDDVEYERGLVLSAANPRSLVAPTPNGTLLPGPIASAVSFATRSTSFALRIGTVIGGYGLGAAKVTTLSSLELGRGILEGILSKAGRDVFSASDSELARADAESILEKSLESLHRTMSQIVFWTATGFRVTGTTVSAASQISQLLLSVLDQFFGSTDSSRAIASIITLVRREFRNPATGVPGERVGVVDLVLGLCGLAYLQFWCRRMIHEESRQLGYEEVIWDVVVLNDGERIDTTQEGLRHTPPGSAGVDDLITAIESHGARRDSTDDDDHLIESQLRQKIFKALPKDARVSISTSTTTTKTITVDIKGASGMSMPSLPGLNLVESEISSQPDESNSSPKEQSSYRVVYKMSRNKVRTTPDDAHDDDDDVESHVEELEDETGPVDSPESPLIDKSPSLPSRLTRPTFASQAKERPNKINENSGRSRRPGSRSSSGSSDSQEQVVSSLASLSKEHGANQKRPRKPLDGPRKRLSGLPIAATPSNVKTLDKRSDGKSEAATVQAVENKSGLRGVLRKNPSVTTFSNFLSRESSSDTLANTKAKPNSKPPWSSHKTFHSKGGPAITPESSTNLTPSNEAPRAPQRGNPNYFSSRDLGSPGAQRKPSAFQHPNTSAHDHRRRNSLISHTDTFSVHSYESRPSTPLPHPPDSTTGNTGSKPKTPTGLDIPRSHQRSVSRASTCAPSIHTLRTRDSQTSLTVSPFHPKSAYSDSNALDTLRSSGGVSGIFPDFHLLRNITRYSRYASAVYGSKFLKLVGLSKEQPALDIKDEMHYDVRSFAHHTKLPPDSILLSSFVDPQGGSDSTGSTDTGIPLVHTVALDEKSKAVVLTCRGTLGFEDVLADMMCDYDDLVWRGKTYQVHKGIHASARRLLYGGDGRVLFTIKAALEEYPEYGLVLCGHSLGGGVTALLGAMLAEPANTESTFVTSAQQHHRSLLTDGTSSGSSAHVCLPSGRPIHVYAYGPPATMSPSLQKATRGLVTSTVHGNDIVPYLSLGVLHDFQALALAFKTDNNEAKEEVRRRVWEGLRSGLADQWYNNSTRQIDEENDAWAYAALKTLRASMMSSKLLPPGEVFTIESKPVMRRDPSIQDGVGQIGKPATRIMLKYIRDVEARFREVRFGSSMLLDHSPGRYEDALRRLTIGVIETR
ncbi:hypothetical protein F5Y16DRAFT_208406 [Xylariaceae sp. FL0255]|nr:hypothetical protein F5Y16DRAFT_208406 [Xylariaceae sp. FL0255]